MRAFSRVNFRKRNSDMAVVALLLVFSFFFLFQAAALPLGNLKTIGPGFYPLVLSGTMMLALLAQLLREKKHATIPKFKLNKHQMVLTGFFLCMIAMLKPVGYLGTALLFSLGFATLLGWQQIETFKDENKKKALIWLPLAAALLVTALDYALFKLAFDFNLP